MNGMLTLAESKKLSEKPTRIEIRKFGPLKEVTFEVGANALDIIYGPPGSGKSYLLKFIYSLIKLPLVKILKYKVNEELDLKRDFLEGLYEVFASDAYTLFKEMDVRLESDCIGLTIANERISYELRKTCAELPTKAKNELAPPFLSPKNVRGVYYGPWEFWSPNKSLPSWYGTLVSMLFPSLSTLRVYKGDGEELVTVVPPVSLFGPAGRASVIPLYTQLGLTHFKALRPPLPLLYVPYLEAFEGFMERKFTQGFKRIGNDAKQLLQELLLGGEVKYVSNELKYRKDGIEVLLFNAAAGVLENGTLAMALIELVENMGDDVSAIAFVEEPEAQLHPRLQRIIVRFLSSLAETSVSFLITSHSAIVATEAIILKLRKNLNAKIYHLEDGYMKEIDVNEYLSIGIPSLVVEGEEQFAELDDALTKVEK